MGHSGRKLLTLSDVLSSLPSLSTSNFVFSLNCKNEKVDYTYDLSDVGIRHPELIHAFIWAMHKKRFSQGHRTRESCLSAIRQFVRFLEQRTDSHTAALKISDINYSVLAAYVAWLKRYSELSYVTAANRFKQVASLIYEFSSLEDSQHFDLPKRAFPHRERMGTAVSSYSPEEFSRIVKAVVAALKDREKVLEHKYQPCWLGKPAPLDDVACGKYGGKKGRKPDPWGTQSYRIWWWENNCSCQRLSCSQINRLPGGRSFLNSLARTSDGKCSDKKTALKNFYDGIAAGPEYKSKYLSKPCPILYSSPWQKIDYVCWYWENVLKMAPLSATELKRIAPDFANGISSYHGGIKKFYRTIGVNNKLTTESLIPYYVMLIIRTGLNPSTIERLKLTCLIQDPTDANKWMIRWEKHRSATEGRTIPAAIEHDTWAPAIVRRVMAITAPFRSEDNNWLWLSTMNTARHASVRRITPTNFRIYLKRFADTYLNTSQELPKIELHANRLRPSIASMEYARTQDLIYIKDLLGHKDSRMTASYINRAGDPILRSRMGLHQNAMLISLTTDSGIRNELMQQFNVAQSVATKIANGDSEHSTLFNSCSAPLDSPYLGQKKGELCLAPPDCCLGCQNLVITPRDIVRHFSFLRYHQMRLENGAISDLEYEKFVGNRRQFWEIHVLPRFEENIVSICREEARSSPPPEWKL